VRHIADLIRQTALAAHALHCAGVVHRDIKPGNIMVTADGRQAVLMDLGLAQLADDAHGKLTRTRQFVGTLRYASPEQVLAVGGVDRRSDVYGLGASLWELLTLRQMFGATDLMPTPELMQRIQYEEPGSARQHNAGVTRDLEAIIQKCLAKDPKRRYESAEELADDLQRFLDDESVLARREHVAQRLWRKAARRPAATALVMLALVAIASLAVAIPKVISFQRSAEISTQLTDLLDRGDASSLDVVTIDRLISQLDRIAPSQAAVERRKVAMRIAQRIDEEISNRPTLEPADETRLKAEIALLAPRNAERSKELEQRLLKRMRSWQTYARLGPPFANLERVFDPSSVKIESGGVLPKALETAESHAGVAPNTFLPTRLECEGNVQLDVVFLPGTWSKGEKIGLLLYDNRWHTGLIQGLAYNGASDALVLLDEQGLTRIWNLQGHSPTTLTPPPSGSVSLTFGLPRKQDTRATTVAAPRAWDGTLGRDMPESRSARLGELVAAVAPAGRGVVQARPGGRVSVFAARDGTIERLREYPLEKRDIISLSVTGDGKMVAAGARDGSISLLVPRSEKPVAVLSGPVGEVNALAFNRAGDLLASGGADLTVRTWNVAKATEVAKLPGHKGRVTAVAFSPDGRSLASGSVDRTVHIWNLGTAQSISQIAHGDAIRAIAYSPDQKTIAVGYGRSVRLWDARAFRLLEELRPQHYALLLQAPRATQALSPRSRSSTTVSLRDAMAANRPVRVELVRDGKLLREQEVPVQADGKLTLSALLEGGKLQLKINGVQVAFHDPVPLSRATRGVFGLDLPSGAGIEKLVANRQRPSQEPSSIEQGDEYFAKGDVPKALEAYRNHKETSLKSQAAQEARCKEGICLAALGQTEEAIRAFEQVEEQPGDRWPIIAGCRLWLLYLNKAEEKRDEADTVYTRLASKQRLEQVASLLPAEIPTAIVDSYGDSTAYPHLIRSPNRLRDLELACSIAREIRAPIDQQTRLKWLLAEGYHEAGQLDRAEQCYAEMLSRQLLSPFDESLVFEHYTWVLGRLNKNKAALDELDKRLSAGGDANHLLLVTRAQVHARRKEWQAARADIDDFFRQRPPDDDSLLFDACLIRGFIREALGDDQGARASWSEGYRAASGTNDMSYLLVAIQASLSNELSAEDARIMYNVVVSGMPVLVPAMRTAETFKFDFNDLVLALRTMWSNTRGRESARKIALLDMEFSEFYKAQVPLSVAELGRYGAFGGTLNKDDDELLWLSVQNLYQDWVERKLSNANLLQLMTTWFGNRFAWLVVAPVMQPGTRGPLAYVAGYRYQKLGKLPEARSFFQTALGDSTAGTTLHRCAKAALDRLNAAK
jgi:tetratricopeptide (TPR) repeat protein